MKEGRLDPHPRSTTAGAPVVETCPQAIGWKGIPEIVGLTYEEGVLRVTASCLAQDAVAQVVFHTVRGFRLLDEGDLLEFWGQDGRPDGWIWQVSGGGWLALESRRQGFVTGSVGGCKEYLLVGQNDCVSVLAEGDPQVVPVRN